MVLTEAVKSKVILRLRPWLLADPEFELNLGLLNSVGVFKNLVLDPRALNPPITGSTRAVFKSAVIRELRIQVSPFSCPALSVDVVGIHVTLVPRQQSANGRTFSVEDLDRKRMMEVLASLDPEGVAVHKIIQSAVSSLNSVNGTMEALKLSFLRSIKIGFRDICFQLELLEESFACLLRANELTFQHPVFRHSCLFTEFLGAFFFPGRHAILETRCHDLELGLKCSHIFNRLVSADSICLQIKLNLLKTPAYYISVPQASFRSTPADIPAISLVLNTLSPEERIRSGRELWKLAAMGIDRLGSHSLYRIFRIAVTWVQYLHAYESLLLSVGYCNGWTYKDCSSSVSSSGQQQHKDVAYHLKLVDQLEMKLAPQFVVRARRIARHKILSHYSNVPIQSLNHHSFTSIWTLVLFFTFLLKLFYHVFCLVARGLLFTWRFLIYCNGEEKSPSPSHDYLVVDIGELCFTLLPTWDTASPMNSIQNSERSNFLFFVLLLKSVCFGCVEKPEELDGRSFYLALGEFQVQSCSMPNTNEVSYSFDHTSRERNGNNERFNTIVASDPVLDFTGLKNPAVSHRFSSWGLISEVLSEQLKLDRDAVCEKLKRKCLLFIDGPFLLCKLENSHTHPRSGFGLLKCSFIMGKLQCHLDGGSIKSLFLLHKQVEYSLSRNQSISGSTFTTQRRESKFDLKEQINSYFSKMTMLMMNLIPKRMIQIAMTFAGLSIFVSANPGLLRRLDNKKFVSQGLEDSLEIGLGSIDFAVCPASKDFLSESNVKGVIIEETQNFIWLKEPVIATVPQIYQNRNSSYNLRSAHNIIFNIESLSVYVGKAKEHQQSPSFGPIPMTICISTCRDVHFSLFTSDVALSLSFSGFLTGAVAISLQDEFNILCQVFFYIYHELSVVSVSIVNIKTDLHQALEKLIISNNGSHSKNILDTEGEALVLPSTNFSFDGYLELSSLEIVMTNLVKGEIMEKLDIPSSENIVNLNVIDDTPDVNCGLFFQKSTIRIIGNQGLQEVGLDIEGINSVIFKTEGANGMPRNMLDVKNPEDQSFNRLHQISVSGCRVSLHTGTERCFFSYRNSGNPGNGSTSFSSTPQIPYPMHVLDIRPAPQSDQSPIHRSIVDPSLDFWALFNMEIGDVQLKECNAMHTHCCLGANSQSNRLCFSTTIKGKPHQINSQVQGGYIFLDVSSLVAYYKCSAAYSMCISNLVSKTCNSLQHSMEAQNAVSVEGRRNAVNDYHDPESGNVLRGSTQFLTSLAVNIHHLSLKFGVTDASGEYWNFTLETDANLDYSKKNFSFKLVRLTILSQIFNERSHNFETDAPESTFCPDMRGDAPSGTGSSEEIIPLTGGLHPGQSFGSWSQIPVDNAITHDPSFENHNYILKHLAASIMVMKVHSTASTQEPANYWIGGGSVSGFDLSISLNEIQILLELSLQLSEISGSKVDNNTRGDSDSRASERDISQTMPPDGAVVAIQDLHEHLYLAVEVFGKKYRLVGVLHYSLVGEKALFRVKYHPQKQWGSQVLRFSLTSLYAKYDDGEPLCLAFCPGSGLVEVLSNYHRKQSLWEAIPYDINGLGSEGVLRPYDMHIREAFHLVNSKSNYAVAFVDGVPEFVKKPGNPFKVKVFNDFESVPDTGRLFSSYPQNISGSDNGSPLNISEISCSFHCLMIVVDEISLTILHQVSDASERIPLVRVSVRNIHIAPQVFPSKFRILTKFSILVDVFSAQSDSWRGIVAPTSIEIFLRSRFKMDIGNGQRGAPLRFHFNMSQMNVTLTEHSLDMLLFVAQKLDIIDPYAVKQSVIFANRCKIENQTGLSLSCHFANDQETKVAGNQSVPIIMRSARTNHQFPGKILVTLCLYEQGQFSTSPVKISLSKSTLLSWKTRVSSLKDSRSFPGPFLVIGVSRKAEEEVTLTVSPLLRVHNESGFLLKLRFQRPSESNAETASILLKNGERIDDSRAVFDAFNYTGGAKKALRSLSLGNYLLSVRPEIAENVGKTGKSISVEWSGELKGEKAIRVSGIFNKLNYRFRKAFGIESVRSSFRTVCCPLAEDGRHVSDLYFLLHTIERDVPVLPPENAGHTYEDRTTPIAFQIQKEYFFSPTIQIFNLLQSEILIILTESHPDQCKAEELTLFGKKATIPPGSSDYLYVNPAMIYITVTLSDLNSRCKPVNSGEWVKKLHKKNEVDYLDIDLDFGGGKYYALLRLSRAAKGILEATIFTPYTLQNNTELPLFCFASGSRNHSREEFDAYTSGLSPDLGVYLASKTSKSWFLRSHKLHMKWLKEKSSEALLDLNILSGVAEITLETQSEAGSSLVAKIGVSLAASKLKLPAISHTVSFVPRYILSNESQLPILVRQCYLECDSDGIVVDGKHEVMLYIQSDMKKRKEANFFDIVFKRHKNSDEQSMVFVQFRLNDSETCWSGPICIASLGRFFLKFRRLKELSPSLSPSNAVYETELTQFAGVHIAEANASLIMHFHFPPRFALPYRIENHLRTAAVTFYQKESAGLEVLGAGKSVAYVWDDLNLPHKLVVQIAGINLLREINIDKVRSWKPFLKARQAKGFPLAFLLENLPVTQKMDDNLYGLDAINVGYEVYTDGLTRVLRICEFSDSSEEKQMGVSSMNIQFRASCLALSFLETSQQEDNDYNSTSNRETSIYSTIIVARINGISTNMWITDKNKYIHAKVQDVNVDEKWHGAPFASMFRRSLLQDNSSNENMFSFVLVQNSSSSNVRQVEYSSIVLQPFDLNLDEETLMRLVKFWRTSLSNSEAQSSKYYFKHFEIHPIKIKASFLLGNDYSSYNSAQEALRSLLHNFIKVPTIRDTVVELNGILLTHALVTVRELGIKCVQHYSWYAVRGIYKAKGSQLLPPAFASLFDDSASSSLDVFFDPSNGSINLPGLTLGMFRFVSTYVNSKGFSGTKRYFGDLSKTVKRAGSNVLFAAVTEISDNILKGAERNGFNGLVSGFHQGLLNIAMEPSLIGAAVMEGGPDRKIKLDRNPGIEEQYIEGYLQAMLDVMYKQDYLRVRINDNQVLLKNLPPNSSLINEIVEQVKSVLCSKGLLNAETSMSSHPIRRLRGENEWKIGPTVLTLCEHLFVSFTIRQLRNQASKVIGGIQLRQRGAEAGSDNGAGSELSTKGSGTLSRLWTVGRFAVTGMVAYIDGRLCRHIPNPIVRRIVSGFMLSYLEKKAEG